MQKENIRIVAFDLDGTLTQHKTHLEPFNRAVLDELARRYRLLMVGAGSCRRIFEQMDRYPIDIIGNYGMQYAVYDAVSRDLRMEENHAVPIDRTSVSQRVTALREAFGFTDYRGENVEFHESGAFTFPILGTAARQEDKLAFDPDRAKRRSIYAQVCAAFPEYNVFVGGSSSFDAAPKPYDKLYALRRYGESHGLTRETAAFVGDDYGLGGNDESVFRAGVPFVCVDDYTRLRESAAFLLKEGE